MEPTADRQQSDEHAGPDKIPWNTKDGWKKVNHAINQFMRSVRDPGGVCAVCGERRHCGKECDISVVQSWCVGSMVCRDIIQKELYPPYPLKTFPEGVCDH